MARDTVPPPLESLICSKKNSVFGFLEVVGLFLFLFIPFLKVTFYHIVQIVKYNMEYPVN